MSTWIEWFRTHLHWFVFLSLEAASLVMLFRFSVFHHSVWATQSNEVVGAVLKWEADMHNYFRLGEQNEHLTQANLVLQHNNQVLREELAALKHDTTYVEQLMQEHLQQLHTIPARVVHTSVRMRDNIITLDKGCAEGVRDEMGVVSGTGVVGIVYEVGEHYSLVLPILNSRSNISCRLRDTQYLGSLKWKGGNILDAYMDDIPRHARFKIGDVVETSGFSSIFPAGIFVGKVTEVLNSPDGLSYELKVRLSLDFGILRDVNIISNPDKPELDSLRARSIVRTSES